MKERTEHAAERRGRPGDWQKEDLKEARDLVNTLPKTAVKGADPRGKVFQEREAISENGRTAFLNRVAEEERLERASRGVGKGIELSWRRQAEIDRESICRALVAHGILNLRTRRVSLSFKSLFRAKIS